MTYIEEIPPPNGRVYRNRNTGVSWEVELEIGGAVWLRDIVGHTQQRRLDELQNRETWERVA